MRKPNWVYSSAIALVLVSPFSACRSDADPPPTPMVPVDAAGTGTGGRSGGGGRGGTPSVDAAVADAPGDLGPIGDGSVGDGGPGDGAGDGGVVDGLLGDGAVGDAQPGVAARPFYSHPFRYPQGVIMPTAPQAMLDAAVASYYDKWKTKHLGTGCGGSYLKAGSSFGGSVLTVSQLHGFGMLATVILAGHDPAAQATFDGMVRVRAMFKSGKNPGLMAREVLTNCRPMANPESQTDGDLDMAMALLMADKQWGSAGAVNYLQEAATIIAALKQSAVNLTNRLPLIGDWVVATDPKFWWGLRTADFMPNHFRHFGVVTNDPIWNQSVESGYGVIAEIQRDNSPMTGLLPDFIQNTNNNPTPAPANWSAGGQANDGSYAYEACRVPLRLALDFIGSGGTEARAKAALAKINTWLKMDTGNNPALIVDGYRLAGTRFGNGGSFAFEGPLGVASMIDVANQAWLDTIWQRAASGDPNDDAYADITRRVIDS